MKQTEVAIIGGGLAGSLAGAMLARAGIDATMIDPHAEYPDDFRCEKLDPVQLRFLAATGLADPVLRNSTPDADAWIARRGRLIERRPGDQRGILYDRLVNTVRAEIPAGRLHVGKVTDIAVGPDRQTVTISDGTVVESRLVILATGLNHGLRERLGVTREVISPNHSVSVGFDVVPPPGKRFPFDSLTYFAERTADNLAYITFFPVGQTMRANLFGYRNIDDPWLKALRDEPLATLTAMWPRLRGVMGDFSVDGPVKIRPVDLYVTHDYVGDGLVLVGDAFATSCPAAGTGARKVLVDVERLCNVYIPHWLATPGMDATKITSFYDDPVKVACDRQCREMAFALRQFSTNTSLRWAGERWGKFALQAGRGVLRRLGALPDRSPPHLAPAE